MIYLRPEWEEVRVLELDLREDDVTCLIERQNGSEERVSLGRLVADDAYVEIRRKALRVVE